MHPRPTFLRAVTLVAFSLPAIAAFIPPDLPPVTPIPDALGRFAINEGILYQLPSPFAFESGDVILAEPAGLISDLVRFFNNLQDFGNGTGIGNLIFMYSDIDQGLDSDDIFPIPADRMFNVVTIPEVGPENGFQGTLYTASLLDGSSISYLLVSDVPEPSSILLLGSALLVLTIVVRKQLFPIV